MNAFWFKLSILASVSGFLAGLVDKSVSWTCGIYAFPLICPDDEPETTTITGSALGTSSISAKKPPKGKSRAQECAETFASETARKFCEKTTGTATNHKKNGQVQRLDFGNKSENDADISRETNKVGNKSENDADSTISRETNKEIAKVMSTSVKKTKRPVLVTNPLIMDDVFKATEALDRWDAPLAQTVITKLNEDAALKKEVEKVPTWPECFARLNVLVGISVENPPPPPKNVVNTVAPALKPSVQRIVTACEKREPAAVTAALKSIPHREMDKIVMVPECQKLMATALGFAQKPLKHLKMTLNLKLNVTVNIGDKGYGLDGSAIDDEQLINGNSFSGALLETLAFYWVAVFAF